MNILLTGGTGFIGKALLKHLLDNGFNVRILTRNKNVTHPYYFWEENDIDDSALENLDGIIHLAGAPLMNKWTKNYKKTIIDSRVKTANLLYQKVLQKNIALKFFISASGSSFYGQQTSSKIYTEHDQVGNDFLAEVCKLWENAANQFQDIGAKVVCIRTPLVLDKNSDSFQLMKMPTQFGLGACLGKGTQWTTWVHLQDLCAIYIEAINQPNYHGAINAVATEQPTHQEFMKELANHLNTKILLPNIPEFLIKLAMGEKADLILEGSRISNQKLIDQGFQFRFNTLSEVLEDIV